MHPLINFPHHFIGGEFFCGAGFEDAAFKHQVGTIGDAQGFLHVVVGDEDADVFGFQLLHDGH